jgi:hypothetical protein
VSSYLTQEQIDRLLAPINPARVETLPGKGSLSYLAQHDVRAHLTRIFGFGRWSSRVLETHFMFEEQDQNNRWKACYRATVELSIHAPDGTLVAVYQDSHASGNAPQPDRAEAHALALTSAVSTAFKRAATNLGDQFGLSLYEKGQRTALVKGTLVHAAIEDAIDKAGVDTDEAVRVPSRDAGECLALLLDARSIDDSGKRILEIAGIKAKHSEILDAIVVIDGKDVTLGYVADRIAAGLEA